MREEEEVRNKRVEEKVRRKEVRLGYKRNKKHEIQARPTATPC
jgi:hypothetical protein